MTDVASFPTLKLSQMIEDRGTSERLQRSALIDVQNYLTSISRGNKCETEVETREKECEEVSLTEQCESDSIIFVRHLKNGVVVRGGELSETDENDHSLSSETLGSHTTTAETGFQSSMSGGYESSFINDGTISYENSSTLSEFTKARAIDISDTEMSENWWTPSEF